MVKANPRATTLESRCLSSSSSTSRDILRCHLSHSTNHGHIHCSHPVAMREHKHASEHLLYWPRAATHSYRRTHKQEREREQMSKRAGEEERKRESKKDRETISSFGTYTDAGPILQQRVEPRVDRKGRGGFAAMTS